MLRILAGLFLYFFGFATTDVSYLISHGYWYPFDHLTFWQRGGVDKMRAFYERIGATIFLITYHAVSAGLATAGLASWLIPRALGGERAARALNRPLAVLYVAALASIALLYIASKKGGYPHYVTMLMPLALVPSIALLLRLIPMRAVGHLALVYSLLFNSLKPCALVGRALKRLAIAFGRLRLVRRLGTFPPSRPRLCS